MMLLHMQKCKHIQLLLIICKVDIYIIALYMLPLEPCMMCANDIGHKLAKLFMEQKMIRKVLVT